MLAFPFYLSLAIVLVDCRLGNMVAMFRYTEVAIYTVSMPPQKLEFNSSMRQGHLITETENVCNLIYDCLSIVNIYFSAF